ncbi:MAG: VC0807 family protein [Propionibacteriaceae bacterium]
MISNTLRAVGVQVVLPIATYLLLVQLGTSPAWALVGSAGVSVLALVLEWVRSRELSTLGLLVLIQFVLSIAVAGLTGNARLVLLKDYVITAAIAVGAAASLALPRPFIARVRRDLSPDRSTFDRRWTTQPTFRRVHRRLTVLWVAGLLGQAGVAAAVIYSTPITVAVIITNILTPAVLLTLISLTEIGVRQVPDQPHPTLGPEHLAPFR